jgi:HAE1 family hydrophobic/amphiphilic exporter-1
MVPMALSTGDGAEMWQPMGIVVIGGLLVSTLLTFFIVPTLYGAMSRHDDVNKAKKVRKNFIFMDIKVKKDEPKTEEVQA